MTKLNFDYWEAKIDRPEDADLAAIHDAFHSEGLGKNGFTNKEKVVLAEMLLSVRTLTGDRKEFMTKYDIAERYNQFFGVNPLFYSDVGGSIAVWRYDYRAYIKEIPDKFVRLALVSIYNRIGFCLEEEDIMKVGASKHLYSCALQELKDEANGRYAESDFKIDPIKYADASFLNMYLLFDKLGLEGRNPFQFFAGIGVVSPSFKEYDFCATSEVTSEIISEAVRRSKGRTYPTSYEAATVLDL